MHMFHDALVSFAERRVIYMEIQKQEVILKIEDLTKSFGKTEVLKGISMEVHKNEIISVLGPSGCGKSTLLNIIAGMLSPDGGRVIMNGQVISEAGKVLPPEKRHMNMVFQDFALWPHMTAYDNIAYGLKRSKTGKGCPAPGGDENRNGVLVPEAWDNRLSRHP